MGEAKLSAAFLMSEQERQNLVASAQYAEAQSLPEVWAKAAQTFRNTTALIAPHAKPEVKLSYGDLYGQMRQFATGLQALGVTPDAGDDYPPRVALFSDNCPRWPVADQGVMLAGGANAVRGSQADLTELTFILQNSAPVGLIVEDLATFKKLRSILDPFNLKFVILLNEETAPADDGLKVLAFPEVLALGEGRDLIPVVQTRNTLATLMYTSGTGGQPKGVMLTHGNLIHQLTAAAAVLPLKEGELVMSILPIWHAYERTFEYFIFSRGCTQVYTNIRYVKQDLKKFQPMYMVAVPRLWESIYEGIQKQFRDQPGSKQKLVQFFLGKSQSYIEAKRKVQGLTLEAVSASDKAKARVKRRLLSPFHRLGDKLVYQKIREGLGGKIDYVVSGGGSIADHLEDFFEIVGIKILSGYGLTETAPITNVRRPWRNIRGADGQPLLDTEIRIVHPETRKPLPFGQQGLILIRGPQIMQGYFRNPEATAKVLDSEAWFDSGDLGLLLPDHNLVITGRAKDTIVLSNGENIDPQPIEDHLLSGAVIDQIMLVGQDQKVLGALVVPNMEALEKVVGANPDLTSPEVQAIFKKELDRVKTRPGYRADERIGVFQLLAEPFSVENGLLTQTLKVKRNVVMERYGAAIAALFR
ncbi:MAG: long-chain fatty acid--CoA ligase [Alkalinema sp. RU_4_3]|nr:long-chain fatty acid--CoA ligase [Alkalinema sp. RU_4_3]